LSSLFGTVSLPGPHKLNHEDLHGLYFEHAMYIARRSKLPVPSAAHCFSSHFQLKDPTEGSNTCSARPPVLKSNMAAFPFTGILAINGANMCPLKISTEGPAVTNKVFTAVYFFMTCKMHLLHNIVYPKFHDPRTNQIQVVVSSSQDSQCVSQAVKAMAKPE
jgi:hypothetical protein